MEKTRQELECEMRTLESRLAGMVKTIEEARKDVRCIRVRMERVKEAIRNEREIPESKAPRWGENWPDFETRQLEDSFQDFLYGKALQYGRSTLSIRFKVMHFIAPYIGEGKWAQAKNLRAW